MAQGQASQSSEVDQKLAALLTNANAVRAIASAVEGTIGPKGLDTLLVDRYGEVVITNDGMTILTKMDVNHPAAKMVVNTARAQEEEVGDGTTTATIMAGALLSEGVNQAARGVPVTRIIDGVKAGIARAVQVVEEKAVKVAAADDPALRQVALVAGRGNSDIADLVFSAAKMVGMEKLLDESFRLSETIVAKEGAGNEVFAGIVIDKGRLNQAMPLRVENPKVLVVDDALEPVEVEGEALATESGFQKYLEAQEEFRADIVKVVDLGARFAVVSKSVDDVAEEVLTDAGIMVVTRVSGQELKKVCEHTGARAIKRGALRKSAAELERYLGAAQDVYEDQKLQNIRVMGGAGKPMATILVGASTGEVRGERERICADAASSVQAAVRGGIVAGGGAIELCCAREVEKMRLSQKGMQAYGLLCVVEALKRPMSQIVQNAGMNPLEKVGDAMARQAEAGNGNLAVDCDSGEIVDMMEAGVADPALVKICALRAALEIACAILRIDTIIKKKDEAPKMEPLDRTEAVEF